MYDSGLRNRNLNLLYSGNEKTRMSVETSLGKTNRVELKELVMQGSVPGGFLCSNQLSKVCNKMYTSNNVYMYMNCVPVPGLCMVDDIVTVNLCKDVLHGMNANIQVDSFVRNKKLECQTGSGKCQWLHIGDDNCPSKYFVNKQQTDQAEKYKYLGDITSNDLENTYKSREDKAKGYRAMCISVATEVSLGYRIFSIAKVLHQSVFLNGTMVNMETWTNCTMNRIESFEKIEQHYFRTILQAHSKTAIEVEGGLKQIFTTF